MALSKDPTKPGKSRSEGKLILKRIITLKKVAWKEFYSWKSILAVDIEN